MKVLSATMRLITPPENAEKVNSPIVGINKRKKARMLVVSQNNQPSLL